MNSVVAIIVLAAAECAAPRFMLPHPKVHSWQLQRSKDET